jgi:hypothetical protein
LLVSCGKLIQGRLHKIKARTQATEIFWIFFGIHTVNAVQIGRRIHASCCKASAALFFSTSKVCRKETGASAPWDSAASNQDITPVMLISVAIYTRDEIESKSANQISFGQHSSLAFYRDTL